MRVSVQANSRVYRDIHLKKEREDQVLGESRQEQERTGRQEGGETGEKRELEGDDEKKNEKKTRRQLPPPTPSECRKDTYSLARER